MCKNSIYFPIFNILDSKLKDQRWNFGHCASHSQLPSDFGMLVAA